MMTFLVPHSVIRWSAVPETRSDTRPVYVPSATAMRSPGKAPATAVWSWAVVETLTIREYEKPLHSGGKSVPLAPAVGDAVLVAAGVDVAVRVAVTVAVAAGVRVGVAV